MSAGKVVVSLLIAFVITAVVTLVWRKLIRHRRDETSGDPRPRDTSFLRRTGRFIADGWAVYVGSNSAAAGAENGDAWPYHRHRHRGSGGG
jgi:hypothetical protein